MDILNITEQKVEGPIPLLGWKSVEAAVHAFADGLPRHRNLAEQQTIQEIGKSVGDLGVAIYLLQASENNQNDLAKRLLGDASIKLQTNHRFSQDYDYGGMGTPFFKSTVSIVIYDKAQDLYGLIIHAARVGDKPTTDLSQHLQIPRSLVQVTIRIETLKLSGNVFTFDFDEIAKRLQNALDIPLTSQQILESFYKTSVEDWSSHHIFLSSGLRVSVGGGCLSRRFKYDNGRKIDRWSQKGAVLSGILEELEPGSSEPADITISVCYPQIDSSFPADLWQNEKKQHVLDIAKRIMLAFSA